MFDQPAVARLVALVEKRVSKIASHEKPDCQGGAPGFFQRMSRCLRQRTNLSTFYQQPESERVPAVRLFVLDFI
jgi:hypothetical protein